MSLRLSLFAAAVSALSCAVVPAALAQSGHGGHGDESAASQAYMEAMGAMNDAMDAMEMSGEPGIDFALMMIPHHQSAIDMARAYLESGENDPELTKLSQDVVAAQEGEIAFLRQWLAKKGR